MRAFFPKDGATTEDTVTGSLNASLAEWLLRTGRVTAPYIASQGTVLGRAGRVVVTQDGHGVIWVGGGTITCVSGEVGPSEARATEAPAVLGSPRRVAAATRTRPGVSGGDGW